MSVESFYAHVQNITRSSAEFAELAGSVSDASSLVGYARERGIDLSDDEAAGILDRSKRVVEAAGVRPLSEDELDKIDGGWAPIIVPVAIAVIFNAALAGAAIITHTDQSGDDHFSRRHPGSLRV